MASLLGQIQQLHKLGVRSRWGRLYLWSGWTWPRKEVNWRRTDDADQVTIVFGHNMTEDVFGHNMTEDITFSITITITNTYKKVIFGHNMPEDIFGRNMPEDIFGRNMPEDIFGRNMPEDQIFV